MRLGLGFISILALAWLTGCAGQPERRQVWVRIPPQQRPAEVASSLMFDPHPATYDAQEFASRSDWPSTRAYYAPGQVLFYNEWFVDYQGRNTGAGNNTYRRAESVRVGVGYR